MCRDAITEASASNMSAPKAVSSVSGKIQVCTVYARGQGCMIYVADQLQQDRKSWFLGEQARTSKVRFSALLGTCDSEFDLMKQLETSFLADQWFGQ